MPNSFHLTSDLGPVGTGACDARRGELHCVYKTNPPGAPLVVANEWVSYRIAEHIGLPVPKAGLMKVQGAPAFASIHFGISTAPSPPPIDARAAMATFPETCHGIIAFDIFVANSDRHQGNLAQLSARKLVVFDHSHALFHGTSDMSRLITFEHDLGIGLTPPGRSNPLTPGNAHCLATRMTDGNLIQPWFDRIAAIPDWLFTDIKKELAASGIVPDSGLRDGVVDWLKDRRSKIHLLYATHQRCFPSLNIQPLLPSQP